MRASTATHDCLIRLRTLLVLLAVSIVIYFWNDIRDWLAGAPRGDLLLFVAVATHDVEGVDRALHQGVNINARNGVDLTALHYACDSGDDAMVKALLARGADPNADAQDILTPLHSAVTSRSERSVALLLAAGGDPNIVHGDGTVLDIAEKTDCPTIVELLRKYGAKHASDLRAG
jgi:ankyrin repeat protein